MLNEMTIGATASHTQYFPGYWSYLMAEVEVAAMTASVISKNGRDNSTFALTGRYDTETALTGRDDSSRSLTGKV